MVVFNPSQMGWFKATSWHCFIHTPIDSDSFWCNLRRPPLLIDGEDLRVVAATWQQRGTMFMGCWSFSVILENNIEMSNEMMGMVLKKSTCVLPSSECFYIINGNHGSFWWFLLPWNSIVAKHQCILEHPSLARDQWPATKTKKTAPIQSVSVFHDAGKAIKCYQHPDFICRDQKYDDMVSFANA